jgi:hypothetical protein
MLKHLFHRRLSGLVLLLILVAILSGEFPGHAAPGPQPPCGSATFPPYPKIDDSPKVTLWDRSDLGRDWSPPACTGWTDPGFTTLVVTVARFRHTSGVEGLLRRVGAISERSGIRYWSTTRKRWQTLVISAYALSAAVGDRHRNDFQADEMTKGGSVYFQQEDNLSGKAIYRMRILTASPDRLVFKIENISTVRYLFLPIFSPGDMQSIYFFERESQDVWRYYGIVRTGRNASPLSSSNEASTINRAVAFYRFLTGMQTDKGPPAAP